MQIAISRTFVDAMSTLEPMKMRLCAAFVANIVRRPERSEHDADIVTLASDGSVRSIRVSQGVRAVAIFTPDRVVLLFVGTYDIAQEWARSNCFEGELPHAGLEIHVGEIPSSPRYGLSSGHMYGPWQCVVRNTDDLVRAFELAGIEHGLVR